MSKSYRIMLSAGEASGDMHAALALKALKTEGLAFSSFGLGGDKMQAQGTELLMHCRDVSVIGIFEVLIKYRDLLKKLNFLRSHLRTQKPDLLIIIDYPDFNLKLSETAKELGIPVLFYISPQVWAWRENRVNRIGSLVSMMAVIFPFEVEFYQRANIPVEYVGHPLVDEVKSAFNKDSAKQHFKIDDNKKVLGIFPGSRNGEAKRVLPSMLAALDIILESQPNLHILLPRARTLDKNILDQLLSKHHHKITVVNEQAYDVLQACDAIMVASGTATLEAALMGTPMAIVYRVNAASYAIMSRMIKIDNIGLVNIVAGKRIVQEFIQKQAQPQAIAKEINQLLNNKDYAQAMQNELNLVKEKMGKGGASEKVAKLIQRMLTQ